MTYFLKMLNGFEKVLVTISMALMVILIFVQVFTRYIMGDALSWTEEASRYLFIWLIFLSIGISFIEKKHISIDIISDRLPKKAQIILQQSIFLILIALSVFLLIGGWDLVEQMQTFKQKSATLQVPMWIVYLSLPIGFLFAILRLIQASILLYLPEKSTSKEDSLI
ncbi:TRAP transporter small permease [Planococcus versutus]|nr:TRAP transporter small permease [Planococcus versutus]